MAKKKVENFDWKPGRRLPSLQPHTDRKLQVIERYLDAYFDTVARNPRIDELKITLVDGFCGGGTFRHGEGVRVGSPLAILRAVKAADFRLNQGRSKPIKINATFHFGDANRDHIAVLRDAILKSEFEDALDRNVHLHHREFLNLLPVVVDDIANRQTAGRSIFVLDQWGYKDVPMSAINRIFTALPKAEIILTFSIDALLNYLSEEKDPSAVVRDFGVNEAFISAWTRLKAEDPNYRVLGQRALMSSIHSASGARYFTPFMMFSNTDARMMMVAHLAQSQTARDKMLGVHWELKNTFEHIGRGSRFELGFDARKEIDGPLFKFSDEDQIQMQKELFDELPSLIRDVAGGGPISLVEILNSIGNRTAGTNQHIESVLRELSDQRAIDVIREKGGQKRPGAAIGPTDQLRIAAQMSFFLPSKKR